MQNIVWLASYPKSGNTWTRIFLANYLANTEHPVSLNQVHRFGMGDSGIKNYMTVNGGRELNLKTHHESLSLRNSVLRAIVANKADVNFVKTHNVCARVHGEDLIPTAFTRSAIYIVRNPLDVTLSYARHFGKDHSGAVHAISNPNLVSTPDSGTVWQFLGDWSGHVTSWDTPKPYPTLVVRYEDMLEKPQKTFGAILKLIGIPVDEARLEKAIRFASFEESVKQEEDAGFLEASPKAERFFSKGKSGQWRDDLEPALIKTIKRYHRKMMKKYGYLDE